MFGMFGFAPTVQAQATPWGMLNIFGNLMTNMMETMQRQIEGALLGSLKVAAVQMLNQQVGQLVGGTSLGNALFITDFNDFLYQAPAQRASLYMNDFFTLTTQGKGSMGNYMGAGDTSGIGGSYASYLTTVGKQATTEAGGAAAYDLDQYTANPQTMFAEGDWRAFNAFISNPTNNPYGYALQAEEAYQTMLAMEKEEAVVKALSSGFLPAEQDGKVKTPAGAIEAVVADVSTLGNKIIAGAQNPTEFLSGVVSAMANRMINNLVQKGIGTIQTSIQREMGNVSREINTASTALSQQLGPAAQFSGEAAQRLNVNVNSQTAAPPSAGQ